MYLESEYLILLKDIILPIATVAISVVAVVFTWRTLYIQKKHNIKSIKPIGKIRLGDYESNIYIRIDNSGIGPLILEKIFLNGVEIPANKMLIESIPKNRRENIRWKNFTGNYFKRTIPAGENLELIRWTPETDFEKTEYQTSKTKSNIRDTFQNWNLRIEYTDIYDSQTFSDELNLSWFGRNNR